MKKNLSLITFSISFTLFILLLFQNYLEQKILLLKNLDEIIPLILLFLVLLKIVRSKKPIFADERSVLKNNARITIFILLLTLLGVMSNIIYRYQDLRPIIEDIVLILKGFTAYLFTKILFYDISFKPYISFMNKFFKITTLLIFIITIINYKLKLYPLTEIRNGLPTQQLFFSHPTYLASFAVAIIIILTMFAEEHKKNFIYIILMSVVVFSTQRNKAIIFLFIYFLLYYIIIKKEKKVTIMSTTIIITTGLAIGIEQIIKYLSNSDWARSALMIKSFEIANDHFPLGGGFGTFATWTSGQYYSPLYFQYYLSHIYGLRYSEFNYVGDTYWPAVLGEFGYIGLILVLGIILQIYKNISMNISKYKYFSQLSLLIYLIILSTSESSFMSPVATILCLVLAL